MLSQKEELELLVEQNPKKVLMILGLDKLKDKEMLTILDIALSKRAIEKKVDNYLIQTKHLLKDIKKNRKNKE